MITIGTQPQPGFHRMLDERIAEAEGAVAKADFPLRAQKDGPPPLRWDLGDAEARHLGKIADAAERRLLLPVIKRGLLEMRDAIRQALLAPADLITLDRARGFHFIDHEGLLVGLNAIKRIEQGIPALRGTRHESLVDGIPLAVIRERWSHAAHLLIEALTNEVKFDRFQPLRDIKAGGGEAGIVAAKVERLLTQLPRDQDFLTPSLLKKAHDAMALLVQLVPQHRDIAELNRLQRTLFIGMTMGEVFPFMTKNEADARPAED